MSYSVINRYSFPNLPVETESNVMGLSVQISYLEISEVLLAPVMHFRSY